MTARMGHSATLFNLRQFGSDSLAKVNARLRLRTSKELCLIRKKQRVREQEAANEE